MKQIVKLIATIIFVAVALFTTSCKTNKTVHPKELKSLYDTYKNGEIDECKYNGATVYIAGLNAYDAGSIIYNKAGDKIGTCNYGEAQIDSMCTNLSDCNVIYRCHNHITGEPFVDKYGLSK